MGMAFEGGGGGGEPDTEGGGRGEGVDGARCIGERVGSKGCFLFTSWLVGAFHFY